MRKYKIIFSLLLLTIIPAWLKADELSFRANAPAQVIAGQPFQISYQLNQKVRDFRAPQMDNFEVLAGPYTSQSQSTSFVNGQRTSTFTLTYTYTIVANKEGSFTIPPASATYERQTYSSNGVRITVLPPDEQPQQSQQSAQRSQNQPQSQQASNDAGGDNLFIRTIVTKTKVYEQEALLLTYKFYFAGVDVTQFTNNTKIPEFKGFVKMPFEQSDIQTELEHYNGRNYQTAVLYQTLLFPQRAGSIEIEPATFEAVLRVQNRSRVRSIFDDFFGSYTNVTRTLRAPGVTIHANALPKGKPADFSGGVGKFNLNSSITTTTPKANEAVTLKLEVSGVGNMKLLKTPSIEWPEGFEVYDPKVNNAFKNTSSGVSGKKTIEYLAIPRNAGEYVIPSVKFSYFDVDAKEYKTLTTPEYTIQVERGENDANISSAVVSNYVNKEDIKQIGSDIRFIHSGDITHRLSTDNPIVFGSLAYWLCYLLPLLLAILIFMIFRKKIKENADTVRLRYKKANKVARKRLKVAKKLLEENKKELFYEEVERAAWTYLSDRLSIPTANLNKENIYDILRSKQVNDGIINALNNVLSTAEFARYAPSNDEHAMEDLYNKTAQIIDQLENQKL